MSDMPMHASRPVSRRTVAKGMAWAVPAVAVAGALPAHAVSGTVTVTNTSACKAPGGSCSLYWKGYAIGFTVTNNTTWTIRINFDCVTDTTLGGVATPMEIYSTPAWEVAPGQSQTVYIGVADQGASPETSISGTVHYTWWSPDETPADCQYGSAPFSAADTPPCDSGTTGQDSNCPPTATGTMAEYDTVTCGTNPSCP